MKKYLVYCFTYEQVKKLCIAITGSDNSVMGQKKDGNVIYPVYVSTNRVSIVPNDWHQNNLETPSFDYDYWSENIKPSSNKDSDVSFVIHIRGRALLSAISQLDTIKSSIQRGEMKGGHEDAYGGYEYYKE